MKKNQIGKLVAFSVLFGYFISGIIGSYAWLISIAPLMFFVSYGANRAMDRRNVSHTARVVGGNAILIMATVGCVVWVDDVFAGIGIALGTAVVLTASVIGLVTREAGNVS
ncbi:hypothetical protein [Rossellomorea marisflavi]|uniref:hypothetical protein n=1 Tax=Rossellomorea marisflavi TaxID=189381 RepID=UPI00064E1D1F|nr:hypothetical protein [Rossellomorea marisflavi]KML03210.1 hypothetical protein VL06_16410 [Rossellomorea marisflavi]